MDRVDRIEPEVEKSKQLALRDLVERFRREDDPLVAKLLGHQLGRMVFNGQRREGNTRLCPLAKTEKLS